MADHTITVDAVLNDYMSDASKKATNEVSKLGAASTKAMDDVKKSTAGLDQSAKQLQGSITNTAGAGRVLNQNFTQLANTADGLTRSMGGVSLAGNAVATAIGVVLGNAIGAAIREVIEGVTQFGRLHNELARTPGLVTQAAGSMRLLRDISSSSEQTLGDLTQQYSRAIEEGRRLGVSNDLITASFQRWHQQQQMVQVATGAGAWERFKTGIGGVVSGLDNATGISRLFLGAMNAVTYVLDAIARRLPETRTGLTDLAGEITKTEHRLATMNMTGQESLRTMGGEIITRDALVKKLRELRSEYFNLSNARTPDDEVRYQGLLVQTNRELDHQISLLNKTPIAARISTEFQGLMDQMVRFGGVLDAQVLGKLRQKIVVANLVPEVEPFLASLRTTEEAELTSNARRLELLKQFQDAKLLSEQTYNQLLSEETFRHTQAMAQIAQNSAQMRFSAMSATMQEAQNLLGVFAGKSKTAAAAAIILNKGLSIAMAVQNTAVASTRALAELGPIAGPPMAASIKAWGAAQVALIAATGIAQVAGLSGGSAPSAGGGSGSSGTDFGTDNDTAPPSRAVHITLEKAALYTAEQVQDLLNIINDEVRNGATLISTENLRA